MTFEELETKITQHFEKLRIPDYAIGMDDVVMRLARSLLTIENHDYSKIRETMFDLVIQVPNARFNTTHGGRFHELYMRALADSSRPAQAFMRGALPLCSQIAGRLELDEYAKTLSNGSE